MNGTCYGAKLLDVFFCHVSRSPVAHRRERQWEQMEWASPRLEQDDAPSVLQDHQSLLKFSVVYHLPLMDLVRYSQKSSRCIQPWSSEDDGPSEHSNTVSWVQPKTYCISACAGNQPCKMFDVDRRCKQQLPFRWCRVTAWPHKTKDPILEFSISPKSQRTREHPRIEANSNIPGLVFLNGAKLLKYSQSWMDLDCDEPLIDLQNLRKRRTWWVYSVMFLHALQTQHLYWDTKWDQGVILCRVRQAMSGNSTPPQPSLKSPPLGCKMVVSVSMSTAKAEPRVLQPESRRIAAGVAHFLRRVPKKIGEVDILCKINCLFWFTKSMCKYLLSFYLVQRYDVKTSKLMMFDHSFDHQSTWSLQNFWEGRRKSAWQWSEVIGSPWVLPIFSHHRPGAKGTRCISYFSEIGTHYIAQSTTSALGDRVQHLCHGIEEWSIQVGWQLKASMPKDQKMGILEENHRHLLDSLVFLSENNWSISQMFI